MTQRKLILRLGDCIDLMSEMGANSVGGVITDPPYGIAFMGKKWDDFSTIHIPDLNLTDGQKAQKFHEFWLEQARRILIPGGLCAAFSATRTFHRLMAAYHAVGFLDVSVKAWGYASGFPKSMNIEKALRKLGDDEKADMFKGYGTALKPAWEPIVVGNKTPQYELFDL